MLQKFFPGVRQSIVSLYCTETPKIMLSKILSTDKVWKIHDFFPEGNDAILRVEMVQDRDTVNLEHFRMDGTMTDPLATSAIYFTR